jgi:hypothetical protein
MNGHTIYIHLVRCLRIDDSLIRITMVLKSHNNVYQSIYLSYIFLSSIYFNSLQIHLNLRFDIFQFWWFYGSFPQSFKSKRYLKSSISMYHIDILSNLYGNDMRSMFGEKTIAHTHAHTRHMTLEMGQVRVCVCVCVCAWLFSEVRWEVIVRYICIRYHRCLWTGHSIPPFYTLHPFLHPTPLFNFVFISFFISMA